MTRNWLFHQRSQVQRGQTVPTCRCPHYVTQPYLTSNQDFLQEYFQNKYLNKLKFFFYVKANIDMLFMQCAAIKSSKCTIWSQQESVLLTKVILISELYLSSYQLFILLRVTRIFTSLHHDHFTLIVKLSPHSEWILVW